MTDKIIIAIDGFASTGKSTLAKPNKQTKPTEPSSVQVWDIPKFQTQK